jgi:hypothetical protein
MAVSYFASILVLSIVSYFYIRKFLNVELPKKDFLKIFVSSVIAFTFLYFTSKLTSSLLIDFILLVFATLLYFFILIPLRFYKNEDVKVLEFIGNKFPAFKREILIVAKIIKKFSD